VIWKSKAGKNMPPAVAKELIARGRTQKPVTGFKGRSGRSFRARLALMQNEEGRWRVEFDEPWAKDGLKLPQPEDETPAEGDVAAAAPAGDASAAA
jgi:DNA topoisomerase-3